jgi:hypothetical protein
MVLVAVAGCHSEVKKDDPRIAKRDALLAKLKEYQIELDKAHFRFNAVATNYERAKDDYQKKLTRAMSEQKVSGKKAIENLEKNKGQLASMISDRDRVGVELGKAFEALIAAQKRRNASAVSLLEIEGKLWELEEKATGGRERLQRDAGSQLTERRTAGTGVRETDRAQGDAASSVINKEVEVSALIGADVQKRDEADQALDKLRDALEAAVTSYVGSLSQYEAAKERYHKRVIELVKAGKERDEINKLLDQRANAAKQLDEAQNVVKTAILERAAQTKQRIAFDSEIDHVVEAGLTAAVKEQVIKGLKKETDAIAKGRTDMQTEDNAASSFQKKIAETEAELNALGY